MLKRGQNRCEVTQREPVRRGRIVQTRSTWKHTVDECRRCDADEVLVTVARVGSEPTQMQECDVFKWRRRSKRSSMEAVISTRMLHEAKRNRAHPRIVIPEYADAMRVSEHHASTPCTRTQRLMINSMMSRCRTRQPESYDTLSAFLHDWLERGVGTEPPTDPRLNDGWCWQPVRALLLLSPGVSVWWWSGSAHMMTDAKHVENLQEFDGRQLQDSRCPAEVWESFRVSVRASPQTARSTRRKAARTSQCQCTRSTCRW